MEVWGAGSWELAGETWGGTWEGTTSLGDRELGSHPRLADCSCVLGWGAAWFARSFSTSVPPTPPQLYRISPIPHLLMMGFLEKQPGLQGPAETWPQALRCEGSVGSAVGAGGGPQTGLMGQGGQGRAEGRAAPGKSEATGLGWVWEEVAGAGGGGGRWL